MINYWTNEDIEQILIQLNNQKLPFAEYEFSFQESSLKVLGTGSSAIVFEAHNRWKKKENCAIKVIGFSGRPTDYQSFCENVLDQIKLSKRYNIVKIFNFVEVLIWIEGKNKVSKVEVVSHFCEESEEIILQSKSGEKKTKPKDDNCLRLQFVAMEKLEQVLVRKGFSYELFPYKLSVADEEEMVKLLFDIGQALDGIHKNNMIHRDVKLENIFYSLKEHCYKLGDFGIAKKTYDGMADTVAFTKGYGAPEVVGTIDDRYDCTADIYSLGMTLYVLLNNMCFPKAKNYKPNIMTQYQEGFIPPEPLNGSEELVEIVQKMIAYHPDDRYQSMSEILPYVDKAKYGKRVQIMREQKKVPLVLGISFLCMGIVLWIFAYGVKQPIHDLRWLTVSCLSLAATMFLLLLFLREKDEFIVKLYLVKNEFWLLPLAYFLILFYIDFIVKLQNKRQIAYIKEILGNQVFNIIIDFQPGRVALLGAAFCAVWILRDYGISKMQDYREKYR